MKHVAIVCLLALNLAVLPSCVAVGGTSNAPQPTLGQQLIDLKAALDKGAITQAEYDQQKANMLSQNHS